MLQAAKGALEAAEGEMGEEKKDDNKENENADIENLEMGLNQILEEMDEVAAIIGEEEVDENEDEDEDEDEDELEEREEEELPGPNNDQLAKQDLMDDQMERGYKGYKCSRCSSMKVKQSIDTDEAGAVTMTYLCDACFFKEVKVHGGAVASRKRNRTLIHGGAQPLEGFARKIAPRVETAEEREEREENFLKNEASGMGANRGGLLGAILPKKILQTGIAREALFKVDRLVDKTKHAVEKVEHGVKQVGELGSVVASVGARVEHKIERVAKKVVVGVAEAGEDLYKDVLHTSAAIPEVRRMERRERADRHKKVNEEEERERKAKTTKKADKAWREAEGAFQTDLDARAHRVTGGHDKDGHVKEAVGVDGERSNL